MALLKIKDFDSNYRETFGGYDIKGLTIYSDVNNEKIGTVHDLLVDEQGHFRYFIVDLGFWGFGKKVLLPVGRSQIDVDGKHVHALGFTKDQAENLPEFNESLKIDNDYEERVRGIYRTPQAPNASHTHAGAPPVRPLEASGPLEGHHPNPPAYNQTPLPPNQAGYPTTNAPGTPAGAHPGTHQGYPQPNNPAYPPQGQVPGQVPGQMPGQVPTPAQGGYPTGDPNAYYDYQQDPALYGMNQQNHSVLQRFEERLITKKRQSGPSH